MKTLLQANNWWITHKKCHGENIQIQGMKSCLDIKLIERSYKIFTAYTEQQEELEMKSKTVQSVVLLNPNRYKRRPYVVKSSR